MKKKPKILLDHILESIEEAVKKLPSDFKKQNPKITWREIAGMRDVLIHDYFGVNINIIWKTIQEDIPRLKEEIVDLRNTL